MRDLLVIGGGFAGMWAALAAAREVDVNAGGVRVTLVSRDPYLTIRPRLYEPFSEDLRTSLTPVLAPLGVALRIGTARSVDPRRRTVHVSDDRGGDVDVHYDALIVAAGSEQRPLAIPGAEEHAWNIDTFSGAQAFDAHLRRVVREGDRPGRSTFVIVGAGFTGIELATEMRGRIRAHGDATAARGARVLLLEREAMVGPELGANPRPAIEAALREAGVEVRLGEGLAAIEQDTITLGGGERMEAATVVVTAGLRAHPIAAQLGADVDPQGRAVVDDMLRVNGVPGLYAAGDVARARVDDERVALMSCQHAVPMGKVAGYNAARELMGLPLRRYRQPDYVTCLDLGEAGALLTVGWERTPQQAGAEAKQLKRTINTRWIYPPAGERGAILAAADPDAPWPPEA